MCCSLLRITEIRITAHQSARKTQNKFSYLKNCDYSDPQMKYYEENSAAMSEDDDNVDIESDVSVRRRGIDFLPILVINLYIFFVVVIFRQDGDDLSADGKSRSANNQYFSQVNKDFLVLRNLSKKIFSHSYGCVRIFFSFFRNHHGSLPSHTQFFEIFFLLLPNLKFLFLTFQAEKRAHHNALERKRRDVSF